MGTDKNLGCRTKERKSNQCSSSRDLFLINNVTRILYGGITIIHLTHAAIKNKRLQNEMKKNQQTDIVQTDWSGKTISDTLLKLWERARSSGMDVTRTLLQHIIPNKWRAHSIPFNLCHLWNWSFWCVRADGAERAHYVHTCAHLHAHARDDISQIKRCELDGKDVDEWRMDVHGWKCVHSTSSWQENAVAAPAADQIRCFSHSTTRIAFPLHCG